MSEPLNGLPNPMKAIFTVIFGFVFVLTVVLFFAIKGC
jgi:hypothetical protein